MIHFLRVSQKNALNICSTAAAVTYENEIKNIEPDNPNMYNDWLRDVKNYDNIANVTNDIYEKVRVSNNDLMTKCPNMKLGLNAKTLQEDGNQNKK